jgi:hypothetical protein
VKGICFTIEYGCKMLTVSTLKIERRLAYISRMNNKMELSQPKVKVEVSALPKRKATLPQSTSISGPEIWDGNNSGWTKVVRKTRGKNKKKQ